MIEIREFIEKELDTATARVMQGDVAVPKHLAFKVAMKAAQYGAAEADPAPSEEEPVVVDASFVDVYSRLALRFLEVMPSEDQPDISLALACRNTQHVIAAAVDFARTLHGRLG